MSKEYQNLEQFGSAPDWRLFTGVHGGPLPTVTYRRAWQWAREQTLSEAEQRSPPARNAYSLRHTCVSTSLIAGVSETLVAQ
ncbi:site-specific integrase [Thermobifida halotolerans]|uniref:hypothetical protein n=1 Tax=Thermobifida halotolerans TaxID=483545 RepID=UPI000AC7FB5A|nr:hypothetical protein [Thermobifida halotolerans]